MLKQSCNHCHKFKVKNARYCWYCGASYVRSSQHNRFETALTVGNEMELETDSQPSKAMIRDNWQVLGMRYGGSYLVSIIGLWAFGAPNPLGYATLPTAAMIFVPPIIEAVNEWRKLAPPKVEQSQADVLRIETVKETVDGPQITLSKTPSGFPASVIAKVAGWVAPPPYGLGGKFSRPNHNQMGLSQGKFKKLQTWMLGEGYIYWKNNNVHQEGVEWSEDGILFLIRSVKKYHKMLLEAPA